MRYCYQGIWNGLLISEAGDSDTDFFYIVTGVLQGDALALFLFIIYLDYILRTSIDLMKENGLTKKKSKSRRYPAESVTDADYKDDWILLMNAPA